MDEAKDTFSSEEMPMEMPMEKSGVGLDPHALMQESRYGKGDLVHMSVVESGIRTKGTFTIAKARYNSSGQYHEYQLLDREKRNTGLWYRESKLKLENKKKSG